MARSEDDLFDLHLTLSGLVSLDRERIEQDPVFRTILSMYEVPSTDEGRETVWAQALQEYLTHYIIRERFLRDVPSTNGPGTLRIDDMQRL